MKCIRSNLLLLATASCVLCDAATLRRSGIHNRVLQEEETGTFLVAEIDYHDGNEVGMINNSKNRLEQTLNIQLENGMVYKLNNVNPSWINGKGKSLESGTSKIKIGKGATISGANIDLHGGNPEQVNDLFARNLANGNHRELAVTGTRSVLAVKVVASDGQYGYSEATLSDEVFGTSGDPVNLVSQYKACSYNQLNFVKAADFVAQEATISNGVVTITVATSVSEGDGVMVNAVTAEIKRIFGKFPYELANHVMYCLPSAAMSGIAYAYINSWNSVYQNQWCNYVSAQMHELGHNLNFAHSNEGTTEYADQSGMMGYSYSSDDGPLMCFNSAKSYQSGWYTTKVVTPSIASCGNYDGRLYGVADFDGNVLGTRTVVVKINDSRSGQQDFFVSYNKQSGLNSGTQEGGNQVMITAATGEGTNYAPSTLLAKLSAGSFYSISNFEGTGKAITVTFEALDFTTTPAAARVIIAYNGMSCGSSTLSPVTPPPTGAPVTPPPTRAPVTASPVASFPTKAPVPVTLSPTTPPVTAQPTKSCNDPSITQSECLSYANCSWVNVKGKKFCTFSVAPPSPSAPTTPPPTGLCQSTGTPCVASNNNCCNGCQTNGRWANTCK